MKDIHDVLAWFISKDIHDALAWFISKEWKDIHDH